MKQKSRLGLRSLLAAAVLLTAATPAARAAELNYTVDDLGPSRYIVDLYTPTNIGYGAGVWTYGLRPLTTPVLTRSITSAIQSGSVNFLGYRNGALLAVGAGVNSQITAYVYQDGAFSSTLLGVATVVFPSPVGVATIPNVSVSIENLGNHVISYNLYNPNSYNSVLNVADSVIDATPGRNAIHTDVFVNSTLNLSGVNRINGATLVGAINLNSGATTFNGNVAGATSINANALSLTYTGLANQIDGAITAVGSATINLMGGNNVNSSVELGRFLGSTINVAGSNVVFNGAFVRASTVRFTTGGSLSLANGVYLDADVDFAGNNATLTVGNDSDISGSILTSGQQSGSLVFSGSSTVADNIGQSGSFRAIDLQGGNSSEVIVNGYTDANVVNLNAAGTVAFVAGLDTRLVDDTLGTVRYFNTDGKVQVGGLDASGTSRFSTVFANFVTDTNNNGVLTMVGGVQSVTGQVGAAGKSLRLLNVGAVNAGLGTDLSANSTSRTTIDGDVFAQTVTINSGANFSRLDMASGHNITGTALTNADSFGLFALMGGTQAATFSTIGSAGARLWALYSGLNAPDISTITGVSYLQVGLTGAGRSDYNNTLNAIQYELQQGTANFNVVDGTTQFGTLTFSFGGTANFHQGLSGNIDFQGTTGTVNIAAGKDLVGNVVGTNDGTLNFAGGNSQLTGSINGVDTLSVGSAGAGVGASSQGTLVVTGNITANTVSLANGSTLDARANVTGDIVTTADGTGSLVLTAGNQTVSGSIGSASASLAAATVGATGTTTRFNGATPTAGVSHVDLVTFAGDGTLVLNGANGGAAASGLIGAVDFTSGGEGTLAIGSGVNLTFGAGGISLQNANVATLDFLGDSTVVGQVGAPASGLVLAGSTPGDIRAGVNGTVVNFGGRVFVSGTTFHVVGTGTVNFADDLVGPLVYEADGTVNFNDAKRVVGVVTTTNDNQGVLNYLGGTTLAGSIGTAADRLRSVNFHTDTTQASSAQSLGFDIFSVDTVIGNTGVVSGNATATVATLTANIHLGTDVTLADASTTLYTSGAQTLVGGTSVDFVHTKNANGTLSLGTVSRSTFGDTLTTNGGTLGFAVAATPFTTLAGNNGLVAPLSSSRLTGLDAGSSLVMSGAETIQVSFLGSLRNNVSATLVDVDGGATGAQAGTLRDNSFTIDTTLSRVNGDLVVTTSRNAMTYVTKSASLGSRGDGMAIRLGALAAAGTGYSASLATVFNKLDLDQWGYGNNAANLARQLQLLTPAGDGAAVQASLGLTSQAIGTVLDASADMTTKHASGNDYWVRAFGGRQSRDNGGEYAGFRANLGGAVVGTDRVVGDAVVGLALGYGMASVTSDGIRAGDESDVNSTIVGAYVRVPVGQFFLNAMVSGAQHDTDTNRQTAVGERAQGEYDGDEFGGTLQFGRRFALASEGVSVTPILAVDYAHYSQDAYAETGAGDIGLRYAEQDYSQSAASLMVRFSKEKKLGEGVASVWNAYLGYRRLLSTPTYDNTVSFVGDTESFFVGGWQDGAKGSVTGGVSYDYNPRAGVTYSLRYDGETKSGFNVHTLGVRATWAY
ncbi:MAG: autotransporter domain-containing protein [Verrucomicrobia bacterium]|nr:autotransporter domain-containing protein [Verrucomicrobiota bacterium]